MVALNLIGHRFGSLVVSSFYKSDHGINKWICNCDCGGERISSTKQLRNGSIKSCGCLPHKTRNDKGTIRSNRVGERHGRLVVKKLFDKKGDEIRWECICDCGKTAIVFSNNLARGHSKSCGCIEKEHPNATIHGWANHPLFDVWVGIKGRCYNKNTKEYKYYGARGVKMCDEWLNNAPAFIKWALENGWNNGLVVDKDIKSLTIGIPALIYSPDMCSIVTQKENLKYTRSNKKYKSIKYDNTLHAT